jgi:hypothetical protein
MDPKARLDIKARKNPLPLPRIKPWSSSQSIGRNYNDYITLAPNERERHIKKFTLHRTAVP